jgi:hypothetical protein
MRLQKRVSDLTPQQLNLKGGVLYKDESTSISDESNTLSDDLLFSNIPRDELLSLAAKLNTFLAKDISLEDSALRQQRVLSVPLSIFSGKLSPLEALSKYMKENLGMTNHNIGVALGRDERGIWITYRNSKRKMASRFQPKTDDFLIHLHIFNDRLSILEALVFFLKDSKNVSTSLISRLIRKSPSTISTVYQRAGAKRGVKRDARLAKEDRQAKDSEQAEEERQRSD